MAKKTIRYRCTPCATSCSAMLWCSGAAAWATATTKQRSKSSSSGVDTRWGSSAARARIGLSQPRIGLVIARSADQVPVQRRNRRPLAGTGPPVGGQGGLIVGLGADPHAVAAVAPGDLGERADQPRTDALQRGRGRDAELVDEHLRPLVGVGQLDAGDHPDGAAATVVREEQVMSRLGEEALGGRRERR